MVRARVLLLGVVAASLACDWVRVPIVDVNAGFSLADVTWFEAEKTLFVFYRVDAEQGLGPESQIEIAWRTDTHEQPWAPLSDFTPVHRHVEVDCGRSSLCGSMSIHVPDAPRDVRLRLRYHRDGEMTLDAPTMFTPVFRGPAHTNRSLIVYGVFDQTNTHVQWRARHTFPTLRNHQVQDLGLRRRFDVFDRSYGALAAPLDENPYGYGLDTHCPADFTPLAGLEIETWDRARFDTQLLPVQAYSAPTVCARTRVYDATGTFEIMALARKNPEVAPAFPSLRSPITENRPVGFLLRPCAQEISEPHRAMQVQRLLLHNQPELCIDAWRDPGFADQLAATFRARIDQERAHGQDMILMFALHHDDRSGALANVIEQALAQVLPNERDKSSPRVSGAFVFDTFSHTIADADLRRLVLWCPANAPGDDLDTIPAASERSCPLMPDQPNLQLGPFRFNNLPILPTRPQYLEFIEDYSEAQAGRTKALHFLAPERTPLSDNVPVAEFGIATFFDGEVMTAAPTDRFSFCASEDGLEQAVVFRVAVAPDTVGPLAMLPEVHALFPQSAYELGLVWDFPFLFRLEYEVVFAGAASAYMLTVPFGIARPAEAYYGTPLWQTGEFPLHERLLRCTRFCDHPTFDSAGVYNVGSPFDPTYRTQCYRPAYPVPSGGGFPLDP